MADIWKSRIQVFTASRRFLRTFGRPGQELDWPNYIAINTSGMVYVSEIGNQRVSAFTSQGHFVTSFGEGLGPPRGIAVDDNEVVYVCYYNNCILILTCKLFHTSCT